MNRISIIGAGGHAQAVIAALQSAGWDVVGLFDDAPAKRGTSVLGVEVVGRVADAANAAAPLMIAIGSNEIRKRIAEELDGRVAWEKAVHPTAWVHDSASIGPGTAVIAGAIIQPGARIGRHVIVNTGASVDHDCEVCAYAHLAPGTVLAGGVTVGEGALFGIGSCAVPGVSVGAWSTLAAGSVVVRDIPAGVLAAGVPARVVKPAS